MATAIRSSRTLVVSYERHERGNTRFREEMECLREIADENVECNRPALDYYDEPGRSLYIVIRLDDEMIGATRLTKDKPSKAGPAIAWLSPDAQGKLSFLRCSGPLMHISRTVIHPDFQGQGFGGLLFQMAFSLSRELRFEQVVVLAEPQKRICEYLKELFAPSGTMNATAYDTPRGVPVLLLHHRFKDPSHPTKGNFNREAKWNITLKKLKTNGWKLQQDLFSQMNTRKDVVKIA